MCTSHACIYSLISTPTPHTNTRERISDFVQMEARSISHHHVLDSQVHVAHQLMHTMNSPWPHEPGRTSWFSVACIDSQTGSKMSRRRPLSSSHSRYLRHCDPCRGVRNSIDILLSVGPWKYCWRTYRPSAHGGSRTPGTGRGRVRMRASADVHARPRAPTDGRPGNSHNLPLYYQRRRATTPARHV